MNVTVSLRGMSGARPADQALVRRCLANDQDACAELVELYARMVGTIIWRATQDEPHVEDLVQETFMRVFRGLPYFSARAKLSTWICTIAHRVAIDHMRSMARAREEQLDSTTDGIAITALMSSDFAANPEEAATQGELDVLLRDELELLPDKYRLPLVYTAIEGLDYETVSRMLRLPLGTVKANVFYAKRMLKDRLRLRLRMRSSS